MAVEVEIGRQFGRWVVVKKLSYKQKYLCKCSCGAENNIRVYDLLKGKTLMCRTCSANAAKSNGVVSNTTEYNTWIHITQRCHNPNNKDHSNYGGRGIVVCDMWRESYEAFLMCVGKKPTPEHTIERLDVNKGYQPGNVVWATRDEQARNKRNNVRITINNITKTAVEWSEDESCTVPLKTIYKRIERDWDPQDAVLVPVGSAKTKLREGPGETDGDEAKEQPR